MSNPVRMIINGKPVEADAADADMNLIDFLHERQDLTGTKLCCGIGVCRACTVGVRNAPDAPMEKTLSCSTPVSAMADMHVYTIEGLAQGGALSPLQQSFLESFAFQCGYCVSGFLMAATAMLDHLRAQPVHERDLDAMIETWVGGNICRCTGYVKYIEAIRKVAIRYTKGGGMTMRNCVVALATMLAAQVAPVVPVALAAANGDTSLHEYAQRCTDEIGEIPAFDCNDGTDVPITVNGRVPVRYAAHMTCDRPALLPYDAPTSGQCTPYSKILDLSHGDTQISAFCRRKQIRANRSPYYDEVDIVLHHAGNGKTCWFHAEQGGTAGMNAARVPPPNETTPPPGHPSAAEFWWKPAATATKRCVSCHDASPVMYSPWIGQVWSKVPTDPWGKYVNLGADFASWTSHAISTPGNTCIGCHRIGDQNSCKIYVPLAAGLLPPPKGSNARASRYPMTHWMPIDNNKSLYEWNAANAKSVSDLLECCSARGKDDPKCSFTPAAQAAK